MFENIGMAVATGGILFGTGRLGDLDIAIADATAERAEKQYKLMAGIYGALFMTSFHILLGKSPKCRTAASDSSIISFFNNFSPTRNNDIGT